MIETVIAIIYTSFICWGFGASLFHVAGRPDTEPVSSYSFIITCFTGLALIGVVFTALSLFMPLGNILSQVLLLIPSLYWISKKRAAITVLQKIKAELAAYPLPLLALAASTVLLILVMHSHTVNHPDTIAYHAQNILWIEKYKAIPGTANLFTNYGIQSSWFVLSALFSFSFTGTHALTFINATILVWFVLFLSGQIRESYTGKAALLNGFKWLLLLIVSLASYTQLRLTASSASPDFIASLYTWLIIYLFVTNTDKNTKDHWLLLFLGCFAITVKLSALPCLLFGLYAWLSYGEKITVKKIVYPAVLLIIVIVPSLARNVISSGYALFPSAFPDLLKVDWKLSPETVTVAKDYITAYARTHARYDAAEIKTVMNMGIDDWMPVWWNLRSLADKIIVTGTALLLLLSLFYIKKITRKENRRLFLALLLSLAGILFWSILAPDPRFGFGFIIPLAGLSLAFIIPGTITGIKKSWLQFGLGLCTAAILSYTAYRCINFCKPHDIFEPAGVISIPHKTIDCDGVPVNVPLHNGCGDISLPCTTTPCDQFIMRGKNVEDGFRPR